MSRRLTLTLFPLAPHLPCTHTATILSEFPPRQTRNLFERLLFFEGRWGELYAVAQQERRELVVLSDPPDDVPTRERKQVRIAGLVLKWILTDKEANPRRAEAMIRQAAAGGTQIVCTTECLLELCLSGGMFDPKSND